MQCIREAEFEGLETTDGRLPIHRQDRQHWGATMKACHVVTLSMLAGVAFGAFAIQGVHAEDTYIRNLPLDALTVPVPVIPPGSTLDLRPTRPPDAADQMTGYRPVAQDVTTPSIGLSIKMPVDDRK